jgi:hypothetical protein
MLLLRVYGHFVRLPSVEPELTAVPVLQVITQEFSMFDMCPKYSLDRPIACFLSRVGRRSCVIISTAVCRLCKNTYRPTLAPRIVIISTLFLRSVSLVAMCAHQGLRDLFHSHEETWN